MIRKTCFRVKYLRMQLSSLLPATLRTVVNSTPKCLGSSTTTTGTSTTAVAAAAFSTTARNMEGYRLERDTFGELKVGLHSIGSKHTL